MLLQVDYEYWGTPHDSDFYPWFVGMVVLGIWAMWFLRIMFSKDKNSNNNGA